MSRSACSVIVVAYNSQVFLPSCLFSITQALQNIEHQILIWDNGSQFPPTPELRAAYPQVTWLDSERNLGFGAACNRAAAQAVHPYLFFVNPDTLVSRNTFETLLDHVKDRSEAGVVGCRILNGDGSLQWACRRSFPSPMAAIYKTLGLASLFPDSRRFGAYNLTYLDDSTEAEVDAVSGSFFCIRKEVYEQVKGFDEEFFLYGEDLDICYRVQKAGYINSYFPGTSVIHFKGQSSRTRMVRSYMDFYSAMLIFARKHPRFRPVPISAIGLGIGFAAFLGVFSRLLPQWWKMVLDSATVWGVFSILSGALGTPPNKDFGVLLWAAVTLPLLFSGDYSSGGLEISPHRKILLPSVAGAGIAGYFLGFGHGAWIMPLAATLLVLGWRRFLHWGRYFRDVFSGRRRRSLLLGNHAAVANYFSAENLVAGREILGAISGRGEVAASQARNHLLGNLADLPAIRQRTGISEILVVPQDNGSHEPLDLKRWVEELRMRVFLAIGKPDTGTFVIVDLNFLK